MIERTTSSPARRTARAFAGGFSALLVASLLAVVPAAAPIVRASTPTVLDVTGPSRIYVGGPAYLTPTVTTGDAAVTEGTFTISIDTTATIDPTSCAVADGACTFGLRDLSVGTWTYTVDYTSETGYDASSFTGTLQVLPIPTRMHLTASPASPVYGSTVTVTASVSTGDGTAAPVPTGSIAIRVGGALVETCSASTDPCVYTTSALGGGLQTITADYSDGSDYEATSGTTTVMVLKAPTVVTVVADPTSGTVGSVFTFHVSVSTGDGHPVTTGSVSLSDGAATIGGCASLASACSITTGDLSAATHHVVAHYSGDANHDPTTGMAAVEVLKVATRLTISADPTSGTFGTAVTVRVSVSTGDGHAVTTGAVSVVDGSRTLRASCSITTGTCVFTVSDLSAGSRTITASYAGSATLEATSGSAIVSLKKTQSITFSPPQYALAGSGTSPITLTARAASGLTVVLTSTTPSICTVSGLVLTPLAKGSCILVATQLGDDSWAPATSVRGTIGIVVSAFKPTYTTSYYVGGQLRQTIPLIVRRGTAISMNFSTPTKALNGTSIEVWRRVAGGRWTKIATKTIKKLSSTRYGTSYGITATYASASYRWRWGGIYLYSDFWTSYREVRAV